MSAFSILNILAARDKAMAKNAPPRPVERDYTPADIFNEAHWLSSLHYRESRDRFELASRWHCVVLLRGDRTPREYFLNGTLDSVARRCKLFFESVHTVTITPATAGPDQVDRRLHTSSLPEIIL